MPESPGRIAATQAALFDSFAGNYEEILAHTVRGTGFPPSYFQEAKARAARRHLDRLAPPLDPRSILVFGCGPGLGEPWLKKYFPKARLFAVDPSPRSLDEARRRNAGLPDLEYALLEGDELPFPGPFDLIHAANVFHHVPPDSRMGVLEVLRRALAPEGRLLVFEHNPWNPFTRAAVARCPMDEGASLLSPALARRLLERSGFRDVRVRYLLFFPAFLRFLLFLEPRLAFLPLGAQYFAAAKKR